MRQDNPDSGMTEICELFGKNRKVWNQTRQARGGFKNGLGSAQKSVSIDVLFRPYKNSKLLANTTPPALRLGEKC